jgi:hypothetical protein
MEKGKPRIALPMLESCLEMKRRVLGRSHICTLASIFDVAECHKELKQYEHALVLYEECLEGRLALLGSQHSDTVSCVKCVASMNKRLKRPGK